MRVLDSDIIRQHSEEFHQAAPWVHLLNKGMLGSLTTVSRCTVVLVDHEDKIPAGLLVTAYQTYQLRRLVEHWKLNRRSEKPVKRAQWQALIRHIPRILVKYWHLRYMQTCGESTLLDNRRWQRRFQRTGLNVYSQHVQQCFATEDSPWYLTKE